MKKLSLVSYAHIGDAVYELFIRELVVNCVQKISVIHKNTIAFVCAEFQEKMLLFLEEYLTEEEQELKKRARNLPLTKHKLSKQKVHRHATAFEVLIGYWYMNDKNRLEEMFERIKPNIIISK